MRHCLPHVLVRNQFWSIWFDPSRDQQQATRLIGAGWGGASSGTCWYPWPPRGTCDGGIDVAATQITCLQPLFTISDGMPKRFFAMGKVYGTGKW